MYTVPTIIMWQNPGVPAQPRKTASSTAAKTRFTPSSPLIAADRHRIAPPWQANTRSASSSGWAGGKLEFPSFGVAQTGKFVGQGSRARQKRFFATELLSGR